jgi:hypothetical protein
MQEHGPIRFFYASPFFSLRKAKDGGRPKLRRQLDQCLVSLAESSSWMINGMDTLHIEYTYTCYQGMESWMDVVHDPR